MATATHTITVDEIDPTILHIGGERTVLVDQVPLRALANVVYVDWRERSKSGIYFGAEPYIAAMMALDSIDDAYGAEDGHSIVCYALGNFQTWRGPVAKVVKAELKRRCRFCR